MTNLETISLAGLLSGVLDLTATSTLMSTQGVPLTRLLQTIASGAIGVSSFQHGKKTAVLGFFFHFLIAFSAAFASLLSTIFSSVPSVTISRP